MGFSLSKRSLSNLSGIHPDLSYVIKKSIKHTLVDYVVIEGVRSIDRQKILVNSGASKTLKSRHLTGHAVDLAAWVDGGILWDWPLYDIIANSVLIVAKESGIDIEWGGNWTTFKDGPHFQLSWDKYPIN